MKNLTADTFFQSTEYLEYLQKMVQAVLARCFQEAGKINPPRIKVQVLYEPENKTTACTDSNSWILLNAAYKLIRNVPDLKKQFELSIGMVLHELSHVLFLDGPGWHNFFVDYEKAGIVREMTFSEPDMQTDYEEMQARIKDNGIIKKIIGKDLKWLENAMNDAIDELLISEMISGYYTKCLFILREEMFDKAETMEERLNKKAADEGPEAATVKKISSLMMQTLWYAKYGKTKLGNELNISPDLLIDLERIKNIIDAHGNSNNTVAIENCIITIATVMWPYYRELLKYTDSTAESSQGQSKDQGQGQSRDNEPSSSGEDSSEKKAESEQNNSMDTGTSEKNDAENGKNTEPLEVMMKEQESMNASMPFTEAQGSSYKGILREHEPDMEKATKRAQEASESVQDGEASSFAGRTEFDKILKAVAEENANVAYEKEKCQELQTQKREIVKEIRREDSYYDQGFQIKRESNIPDTYEVLYKLIEKEVCKVANACSRRLEKELEERKINTKMSGQYMGYLNKKQLYRTDGQVFYRNRIPFEKLDLSLCIIMDESGSMRGNRIEALKNMAVLVDLFVRKLEIPCLMFGHSKGRSEGTIMYHYRDFDSWSKQDSLRLMGITARGRNNDGHVIAYAIQRMMEREERTKVIIVISDGQPHETVHMRDTIQRGRKAGIKIIGAAIGDDAENIKALYGEENFLNITELNNLPKSMVALIKRYIVY